uniref:Immunoglobulin V-set domain-containing protein n=1 Tax=Cyprinus carpio TaxID=7962 RepID=A0A8C1RP12_CYPCA
QSGMKQMILCLSGQVLCFKVIGCSGGSVMFKCMNSNQKKSYGQFKGKYFCRNRNRDCKPGISTELQHKKFILSDSQKDHFTVTIRDISAEERGVYLCGWIPLDKVHVFDDTSAGVLKVFISDLTAADEATYRCAVNTADDHLVLVLLSSCEICHR